MSNQVKWYLHDSYNSAEIRSTLAEQDVPEHLLEKMTEEVQNHFYEVGFDVTYDEKGKITDVQIRKKR